MKKGVLFVCVLLAFVLVMASFACAEGEATNPTNNLKENAQGVVSEIKGATSSEPFEKNVDIPSGLDIAARVFLGIKTNQVALDVLIISIMIFILFFIIIANALRIMPVPETGTGNSFEKNITIIPIAFIVTGLVGFSGAISIASRELIAFGNFFDFLGALSPGAIIFALVFIFAAFSVISKLMSFFRKMKRENELEKAKAEGAKIGQELGFLSSMKEMFRFTGRGS